MKPTEKQLVDLLREVAGILNTHQMENREILRGYSLAANLPEFETTQQKITSVLMHYAAKID